MTRVRLPLYLLGAWFALTSVGFANGIILDGISARSIGRGGTDIAHSDTAGVILDNPAGAANIESDKLFEVGTNFMFTDFGYSDPLRNANTTEFAPLPTVGFIKKSADGRWAYGIGGFAPAGFLERYRMDGPPAFPGDQKYMALGTLGKVLPTLAYRVNDELSIGGTLGVAVSHEEIQGPYTIQGPGMLHGAPTLLNLQATGAALCWSMGMQYKLSDATTLGLTYQSESRFQCSGVSDITVAGLGHSRYDTQLDITWPQSLGLGVRHELCPHNIVSVDVVWYDWTKAFDTMDIALVNSSTGFPDMTEQLPLRWTDSVSTHLGYEHILDNGHIVRCGYVYHNNPATKGTLTPFIQATFEHSFSLGYGLNVKGWDLDLSYMYAFSADQYVAVSDLAGNEFDQSTHSAQAHCAAFSFTKKY